MQDDKQEVPVPETGNERPKVGGDVELGSEVDGVSPETATEKEVESSHEREIEQAREDIKSSQSSDDDDSNTKEEKLKALKEVNRLRDMEHEGKKIEHLVGLAQKNGVEFAIEVARRTNDSCLLDLLHDKIVEKGLGKDI